MMSGPVLGAVATATSVLASSKESRDWSSAWIIAIVSLGVYLVLMIMYVLWPVAVSLLERRAKDSEPLRELFSWEVISEIASNDNEITINVRFKYLGDRRFGSFRVNFGAVEVMPNGLRAFCNKEVESTPSSDNPPQPGKHVDFHLKFQKPTPGKFALFVNSISYRGASILSEDQGFQVPGEKREYWTED